MIKKVLHKIIANSVAIYITDHFIDGMSIQGGAKAIVLLAITLTLANIFLRPVLKLVSLPFIFLSGGIFILIINAIILYFSSLALPIISPTFGLQIESLTIYAGASFVIATISWFEWLFIHPRK